MRIKAFSTLALGVGLGVVGMQLAACSNSADDCTATASCGTSGNSTAAGTSGKSGGGSSGAEGGSDGAGTTSGGSQGTSGSGGGGGSSGSECNGDVANDPTCWTTNELGVFVSSDTGDDTAGDGTKEKPFASISKAIGAAAGKNVYVCLGVAEAYAEKITITATEGDGAKIYGGFLCSDWTHDVGRYVSVESPGNVALRIQDATSVHIENLKFKAADAAGNDMSSYGAFITDSQGVVLRRVELTAGNGQKGADGESGTPTMDGVVASDDQNGQPALCGSPANGTPGSWPMPVCGSKGGDGGIGALDTDGGSAFSGIPSANVTPPGLVNLGIGASDGNAGDDGDDGGTGNAGPVGDVASTAGTFLATGFAPADGNVGKAGFPGQGGGGGGASRGQDGCRGASGGAGGMGGCGGNPGQGGKGGGASVGLFSWDSDVSLEFCAISSGVGGDGGTGGQGSGGGAGADGGVGGKGDTAKGIARGGNGGFGGPGGNGGSGSGGTGGPSLALVFSGPKPVFIMPETTLSAGQGGEAGPGGKVLQAQAPSGFAGASAPELEIL